MTHIVCRELICKRVRRNMWHMYWVTNSCEWVTNLQFCESRKYAYGWITFYFEQVTNANGSVMNSGESCFIVIRVRDIWVRDRVIWHMDESRSNLKQFKYANASVTNSGESCFRVIRVRDIWVRYRVIWHMDESRSNTKWVKYKNVSVTKSGVRASEAELSMNDSRTHMME